MNATESKSKKKNAKQDIALIWLDNTEMKQMFKVSNSTLYRWRKNQAVIYRKIGKKFFYPYNFVTKTLAKQCSLQ